MSLSAALSAQRNALKGEPLARETRRLPKLRKPFSLGMHPMNAASAPWSSPPFATAL